ncbi:MAG: hypothetical protein ACAH83_04780, partial [Alphaproteobacteria bacterium]
SDPITGEDLVGKWRGKDDGRIITFALKLGEDGLPTKDSHDHTEVTATMTPAGSTEGKEYTVYHDNNRYVSLTRHPVAADMPERDEKNQKVVPEWAKEKITTQAFEGKGVLEWRIAMWASRGWALGSGRCAQFMKGKGTYGEWEWNDENETVQLLGKGPEIRTQEYKKIRYHFPAIAVPPIVVQHIGWDPNQAEFPGQREAMSKFLSLAMERSVFTVGGEFLKTLFDSMLSVIPAEGFAAKLAKKMFKALGDKILTDGGFGGFVEAFVGEVLKSLVKGAPEATKQVLNKLLGKVAKKIGKETEKLGDSDAENLAENENLTQGERDIVKGYLESQCRIQIAEISAPPGGSAGATSIVGFAIVDTVEGTAQVHVFVPGSGDDPPVLMEANMTNLPEEGHDWDRQTSIQFRRVEQ